MVERELSKPRAGARKMRDVPSDVLAGLAAGEIETVNLMEWLATDMSALARSIAATSSCGTSLRMALLQAASEIVGAGVTQRLRILGAAIAASAPPTSPEFGFLAEHKSDLVRQWACYAVNDSSLSLSHSERLDATLPFAADRNMSVRETAWMAFRPHLAAQFDSLLPLLVELAGNPNENIRRFAVEVTRPRSVWGAHLPVLKREPSRGLRLLEQVKADSSRYVKLAVGNWLNDASKSCPEWVVSVSQQWAASGDHHTHFIVRRGLRSISKQRTDGGSPTMAEPANDTASAEWIERAS